MGIILVSPPTGKIVVSEGLQGPPGASGAEIPLNFSAGETIGSNRVVRLSSGTAMYADNTILSHANKVIGISTQAKTIGQSLPVQVAGVLDGFTGLTPDAPVYLQANGVVNSTLPTSGFVQQIGIATTSTKILINIQPIVNLI
jgi:hypothetical protein